MSGAAIAVLPMRGPATQVSPTMTSNTSPSGYVASAISEFSTFYAFHVFDGTTDVWYSLNTGNGAWVGIQLNRARVVTQYRLTSRTGFPDQIWTAFKLQGSADGSSWNDVDTQTGQVWTGGDTKTYNLSPEASYTYWRVIGTVNTGGGNTSVEEFSLWGY